MWLGAMMACCTPPRVIVNGNRKRSRYFTFLTSSLCSSLYTSLLFTFILNETISIRVHAMCVEKKLTCNILKYNSQTFLTPQAWMKAAVWQSRAVWRTSQASPPSGVHYPDFTIPYHTHAPYHPIPCHTIPSHFDHHTIPYFKPIPIIGTKSCWSIPSLEYGLYGVPSLHHIM